MDILMISNMYPNKENPSYGIFVEKSVEMLESEGINIQKIVMYKTTGKIKKILSYILFYFKIIYGLIFGTYDILYVHYASHSAIPIILGKILKRNIVIYTNVHGSDVIPEKFVHRVLQIPTRKLIGISDVVIVPSNYFKDIVKNKYKARTVYISPSGGVDRHVFKPQERKFKEYGLKEEKKYIGFIGRIDYEKGWDDLINAFALLDSSLVENWELIIVGSGKQNNDLSTLISEKKLNEKVKRFDLLPHNKLSEVYNLLDVFVFPTRRAGESLGLVGLESLSCGIPVIGSKIGGLREYIIDKENGLLYEAGNVKELAQTLEEYMHYSHDVISEMKKKSIESSNDYDKDNVKKHFVKIFKQVGGII
ncbi:glycosyltransferase family 4 protein [Niallia circulans]|uniref:Glycosyltransferase family 4 protein n=1 Tax=Niallia circulans TaxID=1397 RepID=A0A553SIL1_NIACI|nr:glycosyltransferase [Niallia circulans]TRZ36825.1 glycosyltransferase family 4 protein [Niallia circulans]